MDRLHYIVVTNTTKKKLSSISNHKITEIDIKQQNVTAVMVGNVIYVYITPNLLIRERERN